MRRYRLGTCPSQQGRRRAGVECSREPPGASGAKRRRERARTGAHAEASPKGQVGECARHRAHVQERTQRRARRGRQGSVCATKRKRCACEKEVRARTYRSTRRGEAEGAGRGACAPPSASGRVHAVVLRRTTTLTVLLPAPSPLLLLLLLVATTTTTTTSYYYPLIPSPPYYYYYYYYYY